jgi:hypothetical protein
VQARSVPVATAKAASFAYNEPAQPRMRAVLPTRIGIIGPATQQCPHLAAGGAGGGGLAMTRSVGCFPDIDVLIDRDLAPIAPDTYYGWIERT